MATRGRKPKIRLPDPTVIQAETRLADLELIYCTLLDDIKDRGVTYLSENKMVCKNPAVQLLFSCNDRIRRLQTDIKNKETKVEKVDPKDKWKGLIA